jgi:hypothetical protein
MYHRLERAYKTLKTQLAYTEQTSHEQIQKQSRLAARTERNGDADRIRDSIRDKVARGGMVAFNQEFERENRLFVRRDAEDGYAEWLTQKLPEPEPLESFSHFEKEFANRAKGRSTSLVVREEPVCPAAVCTLSPALSDETQATEDFSSGPDPKGVSFTDLRVAHDARLIDPSEAVRYSSEKEKELLAYFKEQQNQQGKQGRKQGRKKISPKKQ